MKTPQRDRNRVSVSFVLAMILGLMLPIKSSGNSDPPPPPPPPECEYQEDCTGATYAVTSIGLEPSTNVCLGTQLRATMGTQSTPGTNIITYTDCHQETNNPGASVQSNVWSVTVGTYVATWVDAPPSGNPFTFTPTNCGGGTVSVTSYWLDGCDTNTVQSSSTNRSFYVANVDIAESSKYACAHGVVSYTLTNSCGEVTWEVSPTGAGNPTVSGSSIIAGTNLGPFTVTARSANNTNCTDSANLIVIRIQPKVTSIQGTNTSLNSSQYVNSPPMGPANNLLGLWHEDKMKITVEIEPGYVAQSLPSNFIVWRASGFTVPTNSLEWTFQWNSPGIRIVSISFPQLGCSSRIVIDQPDVGDVSEAEARGEDGVRTPWVIAYGYEAVTWSGELSSTLGPAQANALQHAYWSALMASDPFVGANAAIYHTTAHEYSNKFYEDGHAHDSTSDLHNNAVGAGVIHMTQQPGNDGNPTMVPDRDAIKSDLLSKLNAGVLWIVDTNRVVIKSNGEKIYAPSNCCWE